MKALTLWRPWSEAIVRGPKRVENRPWPPWREVIGQRIAIHAGSKYDLSEWGMPEVYTPPPSGEAPRGVVGVARIAGFLDLRKRRRLVRGARDDDRELATRLERLDEDPWWIGPVGWLLEDVRALAVPIPCGGALGLWRLPTPVERQLRTELDGLPARERAELEALGAELPLVWITRPPSNELQALARRGLVEVRCVGARFESVPWRGRSAHVVRYRLTHTGLRELGLTTDTRR